MPQTVTYTLPSPIIVNLPVITNISPNVASNQTKSDIAVVSVGLINNPINGKIWPQIIINTDDMQTVVPSQGKLKSIDTRWLIQNIHPGSHQLLLQHF